MEKETPCFPLEIITNILVRLPVKCLIQFQCVCKDWKDLFRTPSFIAEHLHHSTKQNPLLLVRWTISEGNPWHLDLMNQEMQALEFQAPHIVDSFTSNHVHSSNGLLCVELTGESLHSFWLWNPAIRVIRQVPKSNNFGDGALGFLVGFEFSPMTNDYKIVRFRESGLYRVEGEVYSSRMASWRKFEVGNFEDAIMLLHRTFTCNGVVFSIAEKKDVILISSFDIAREVFTFIPFPFLTSWHRDFYYALTGYENKLAMFSFTETENSKSDIIDMWVLEESIDSSSERWSWTKIYTSKPTPNKFTISPAVIWRNEIVCLANAPEDQIEGEEENYKEKVVLCNLTTDEFNLSDYPKRLNYQEISGYVESLVLLDNIHI